MANDILVVGPTAGPDIDFVQIASAVAAASDGDVILVRPGTYSAFTIEGKSLSIVGDVPAGAGSPLVTGIAVRGISAHGRVVLRQLRTTAGVGATEALLVEGCAGPVVLEEVEAGGSVVATDDVLSSARIGSSATVLCVRCELRGIDAVAPSLSVNSPALVIVGSDVALYACEIAGGAGIKAYPLGSPSAPTSYIPSAPGAPGVLATAGSKLLVAGGTVRGGAGGAGLTAPCAAPSDGGVGLVCGGKLERLDAAIEGGSPGAPGCPGQIAQPGAAVQLAGNGSAHVIPDVLRTLAVTSPAAVGSTVVASFRGVPGENVLLLVATDAGGAFVPALDGTLLGAAPLAAFPIGKVPTTGEIVLALPLTPGSLPVGAAGATLHAQGLVAGAGGDGILSAPSSATIVR